MEPRQTQLEFADVVVEVPDSSAAARLARKERARVFAKLRREEKAAERRQEKELVEMLIQLGVSHHYYGNYEESIPPLLRALELDPAQTAVREYLVDAYMHMEAYESAKDLLIDALRDNPEELWAYIGLARHYSSIESNIEMAQQLLTRALELDPDNVQAHKNLGSLHFVENRLDEALAHFDRVISHQPENAHAHYGRVMAYLAKDLLSKAELALKLFAKKADITALKDAELLEEARESMTQWKGIV